MSGDLQALYRSAFGEWAARVRQAEDMRDSDASSTLLEDAALRAETAETHYREARNRLADQTSETAEETKRREAQHSL